MSLVLVADDEPAVLEVLSQVVEDLGHDVIQARDGEEAWNLARARRPNLVVTDHMMPRLSGLDLCRRLRGDEVLGHVPIILLSAVLPHGAPEAHAFLHKPFEITDFEALIRNALTAAPRPKPLEGASVAEALGDWVARGFEGPLSAARAEVVRLRMEGMADRGMLESLGAHLKTLEGLTRDFQEAAHLAARAVTLRLGVEDLGAHVRQALDTWKQRLPEVEWTLALPAGPVELRLDPERMHRVLDKLLGQAGQHGGEVRVEMESTPSMVTVRVKDRGPGLSDEEQQHIFDPFRAGGPGGALGLYIASELSRLHGGGLSVESKKGQGTTFSVILPRG
ncbi:ATP-binding protein [Vitiosangium sp. GDMCC 1.1324]|uniref:ATP-binding response regulator n=1 Tax=Vitiosangium sp. (strain GDMCC 1.1324) TaxID=2138576 RepID=UPI000D36DC00|nr:ATP-binding protein [Vitiosangium sp. GDMCC 1.1324]PTL85253.1 hybrid sensor histidine kinase/response regulator [Vitiosangium sp. GDMCC 1.1324]